MLRTGDKMIILEYNNKLELVRKAFTNEDGVIMFEVLQ